MNVQIAIHPTGQIKRMIAKLEPAIKEKRKAKIKAIKEKRELEAYMRQYAREFVEMIQTKDSKNPQVIGMNDNEKMEYLYMKTIGMKRKALMLISRYLGIHRGVTTRRHDLEMMITRKIRLWTEDLRNGWFD